MAEDQALLPLEEVCQLSLNASLLLMERSFFASRLNVKLYQ